MKQWLVTGAAGFIGFHTARRLLKRGDAVVGVDNLNDYYDVELKHARLNQLTAEPNFQFRRLDLVDRDATAALFHENAFDAVIHLAAQAGAHTARRYQLRPAPQSHAMSR